MANRWGRSDDWARPGLGRACWVIRSLGHVLSTPLWCLSLLPQVLSFEDLKEGQVLGVATTGMFLQQQGEAVSSAECPVVVLSLLHSDTTYLMCLLCADVNHVIARKARWSRKHRAQMRTQL